MLSLDVRGIRARVDLIFKGNIAAVALRWPTPNAPDRATLGRWLLRQSLPRTDNQVLSLAGALNLDPFALWSLTPSTFPALCARLVTAFRVGKWERLTPALTFIKPFIEPTSEWPPAEIANTYFDRRWRTVDFEHSAKEHVDYFAAISIELAHQKEQSGIDQVLHFAWRGYAPGELWRPYGFIRVAASEVRLYSYKGLLDLKTIQPGSRRFFAETWFGQGAARFRIASLHNFKAAIGRPVPQGVSSVRFT
jgi:hypothetical protein